MDHRHKWIRDNWAIVGGCRENPGLVIYGSTFQITSVCAVCGRYRIGHYHESGAARRWFEYRPADHGSIWWINKRRTLGKY